MFFFYILFQRTASHQVHQIHQNHPESLESSESPRLIGIIRITESITKAEFVHFTGCTSVQYSLYCFCRPSFAPASADENIFRLCSSYWKRSTGANYCIFGKIEANFQDSRHAKSTGALHRQCDCGKWSILILIARHGTTLKDTIWPTECKANQLCWGDECELLRRQRWLIDGDRVEKCHLNSKNASVGPDQVEGCQ